MGIMDYLGFTKRGADKAEKEDSRIIYFTDSTPRKEGETRIFNLIILDESGSMTGIRHQALEGVNETIRNIRKAQEDHPDDNQMIAFVTFSSKSANCPFVRKIIDCAKVEAVQELHPSQYIPGGCTPLHDAMGFSINALREIVKEGDHVLVTAVTDGLENDSRYYDAEKIRRLVSELQEKGWSFTYIGANQHSDEVAHDMGIRSSMDFAATAEGADLMWNKLRSGAREFYKDVRYSKKTGQRMHTADYFSEEKISKRVTPDPVVDLKDGEIFVFFTDADGRHESGAARLAVEKFGAVVGQQSGLQGRSYAIPTGGMSDLAREIESFINFADCHPEMTFLVTHIGRGKAGLDERAVARLFAPAYSLPNVCLPPEFWKELIYKY